MDQHRPIIIQVKNNNIKTTIIKKRGILKKSTKGYTLADDVTKLNVDLLHRLNKCDLIEQAWFFNGHVYGKTKGNDNKIRFDIHDNIEVRVKRYK